MATELFGTTAWVKLTDDGVWPVGHVQMDYSWAGFARPPGYTEENSVPADGRVIRLADWPDFAAVVHAYGEPWPFGGDDRRWWERLLGRPQRTVAVVDMRGRMRIAV